MKIATILLFWQIIIVIYLNVKHSAIDHIMQKDLNSFSTSNIFTVSAFITSSDWIVY